MQEKHIEHLEVLDYSYYFVDLADFFTTWTKVDIFCVNTFLQK